MKEELIALTRSYDKAVENILDVIKRYITDAGGFINTSNNNGKKQDIKALVFDSAQGHSVIMPIKAMRVSPAGAVEVYLGRDDSIYTEKYLRGERSSEHWKPLKGSDILFYQTVMSIAETIDEYLG